MNEKSVRKLAGDVIFTNKPTQIADRLFITGEIPRVTEFEDTGGPFFVDEECIKCDPFLDDQALFFESSRGIVVLLGCAHAGVINTLLYIQQLTHGKPIHAV
ncbi:MAG: MBL fold metallo-hydrolase, partial [Deltaproteobacteria bacterium]|nr:MBL fold metallo-hydrolase [Deltaproteobacteria bacterium]